jgi:transcriptional regulator NrdR family protein
VIYTRSAPGGVVVRRRACRQCGNRITTREREIGA